MWILLFITLSGEYVIDRFPTQGQCLAEARLYNQGSFRDEIFTCRKAK